MTPAPPPRPRVPISGLVQCPHCGAENNAVEDACGRCGKALAIRIEPPRGLGGLGLRELMAVTGAIALGLGIVRENPVAGVLYLAFPLPSLIRMLLIRARERAWGCLVRLVPSVEIFVQTNFLLLGLYFPIGLLFVVASMALVEHVRLQPTTAGWTAAGLTIVPAILWACVLFRESR